MDAASGSTTPKWEPISPTERRVLGVLVEKAKTTPEQYPLTANSLRTGCNQKNNRDPAMSLSEDQVGDALEHLRALGAVTEIHDSGRALKYRHRMYEWLGVEKTELAVMAELFLRGPQTEGELRGRASRMEPIEELGALRTLLDNLKRKGLIEYLTPAGRGAVVSHLLFKTREIEQVRQHFAGAVVRPETDDDEPVAMARTEVAPRPAAPISYASSSATPSVRSESSTAASAEIASLRRELAELRQRFEVMRGQLTTRLDDLCRQLGVSWRREAIAMCAADSAARASQWRLRTRVLQLPRRPLLMGIINATPDSFSDGGKYFSPEAAIAQALQLAVEGADILDVGGESTRPYSQPVTEAEEMRRVMPVIEAVRREVDTPISIDTTKPGVAREALAAGAEIINDISSLADDGMLALAVESGAGVCAMHMRSTATMQDDPHYGDVVREIYDYLAGQRDRLVSAGIVKERISLDPGIGFGKTHAHNLQLMRNAGRFLDLGCPILIGHSRKGFIGKTLGDKDANRTFGTLGASLALAQQGVQILRVHDVAATRQAWLLFEACST